MAFIVWGIDPVTSISYPAHIDSNNILRVFDPEETVNDEEDANKPEDEGE